MSQQVNDRTAGIKNAEEVYRITKNAANTNSFIQGGSGFFGMGWNLAADAVVLPLYVGMWNQIRDIYGQGSISVDDGVTFVRVNVPYLINDLIVDKALGTIPIVGIPLNYTYARALTWRLGIFFGLMAAIGAGHEDTTIARTAAEAIEKLFPFGELGLWKTVTFQHQSPDRETFVHLLARYYYMSPEQAQDRLQQALDILMAEEDDQK